MDAAIKKSFNKIEKVAEKQGKKLVKMDKKRDADCNKSMMKKGKK